MQLASDHDDLIPPHRSGLTFRMGDRASKVFAIRQARSRTTFSAGDGADG
jgi:hypothetical protein